jgi:hypothetical protein
MLIWGFPESFAIAQFWKWSFLTYKKRGRTNVFLLALTLRSHSVLTLSQERASTPLPTTIVARISLNKASWNYSNF